MRIAYVAAGAGGMYCGSCIHDNTLAAALGRLGHEVALVPTYTPLRTDEESVALPRVFYGALSVYLEEKSALFRRLPRFAHRLLARPRLLSWIARLGASTDARELGALTLSVLEGEDGHQARELEALAAWLDGHFRPDVVHITNSMFLGMVRRLKARLGVPVVVSLQGEDLFLDDLREPYKARVLAELRRRAADADLFVAPSRFYAERMAGFLGVPAERIAVVPLGLRLEGHGGTAAEASAAGGGCTLGYLARVCPEKGLHLLAEAFRELASEPGGEGLRLRVAGYLGARDRAYFEDVVQRIAAWGLADRCDYLGEVDREGKIRFLRSLDLLSVPTTYREPKGLFVLEALANGVPVVQPRHGSFPELLDATGGGLLVEPGSATALAAGLRELIHDPDRRRRLGRRGQAAVHASFGDAQMAEATLAVYRQVLSDAAGD